MAYYSFEIRPEVYTLHTYCPSKMSIDITLKEFSIKHCIAYFEELYIVTRGEDFITKKQS